MRHQTKTKVEIRNNIIKTEDEERKLSSLTVMKKIKLMKLKKKTIRRMKKEMLKAEELNIMLKFISQNAYTMTNEVWIKYLLMKGINNQPK